MDWLVECRGSAALRPIMSHVGATWNQAIGVADRSIRRNHGWRHRFKMVGREAGIDSPVLDVGERLAWVQVAGVALVLSGIALVQFDAAAAVKHYRT